MEHASVVMFYQISTAYTVKQSEEINSHRTRNTTQVKEMRSKI